MRRRIRFATLAAAFALAALPVSAQVILPGTPTTIHSPLKTVAPIYPDAAARANVRGQVELWVHVDTEGRATQIEVTKSFPDAARYGLEQAAIDAVKQWEFGPAVRVGRVVPYEMGVSIDFPPAGPSVVRYEQTETGRIKLPPPYADAAPIETEGLTPPALLHQVTPSYSAAALRARLSGDVLLDIVVAVDGTVAGARVVKSLDPALDANALDAVAQWRYTAGRLLGNPVPVRMTVTVQFRTR